MKIICYSQKHLKSSEQSSLRRELYGFKDISNKGKYVYRREGLLNESNHKKIFFTGIIVNDKYVKNVIQTLKKHKALILIAHLPKKT